MFDENLVENISNNYLPFKIDQINLIKQEIGKPIGKLFINFNISHASILILKNAEIERPLYESNIKYIRFLFTTKYFVFVLS
jgi:hypothetical protein